jgi:hypothetical protein
MLPRSGPQDANSPFGATSKDRAMPSGFSSPPPPPLQGWRALFWSDVCARVPRPVSRSVGGGALSTAPITCPRRKPRRPISSLDFRGLARRDANLHPIFPPRTAPSIPAHPCPGSVCPRSARRTRSTTSTVSGTEPPPVGRKSFPSVVKHPWTLHAWLQVRYCSPDFDTLPRSFGEISTRQNGTGPLALETR